MELIDSPDALLGHGERGEVRLGCLREQHGPSFPVAVKLVSSPCCLPLPLELPALPRHPNIVRVIKRSGDAESWAEVRALCGGGEMYDRVAEEGSLTMPHAMTLFAQLASAVAHCHAHGVAHGQLRAEHVLLDEDGQIQLIGFGRPVAGAGAGAGATAADACGAALSAGGSAVLRPVRTLDAPEWHTRTGECPALPLEELAAADVWSMAVLLAVMLSGGPPFASSAAGSCPKYTAFLGGGGLAAALGASIAAQLPAPLATQIERALQMSPSARPSAADLEALLLPGPTARMPSPVQAASVPDGPKGGWAVPNPMPSRASRVGGGARSAPTPPVRPTASQGYVRALGWQALPHGSETLVGAIRAALDRLSVPYMVRGESFRFVVKPRHADAQVPPTPQSASPPLTASIEASPAGDAFSIGGGVPLKPRVSGSEADVEAEAVPGLESLGPVSVDTSFALQPLVIFVQVYREDATSARHDVSVRRVQGTSWRFQSFYAAFRDQVMPRTMPLPLPRQPRCLHATWSARSEVTAAPMVGASLA